MKQILLLTVASLASIVLAACGGGDGPVNATPTFSTPSGSPVEAGINDCVGNLALLGLGNSYEVEEESVDAATATTPEIVRRYSIKYDVLRNTVFQGSPSTEIRGVYTYTQNTPTPAFTEIFVYRGIEGSDILLFGNTAKTVGEGILINSLTVAKPFGRIPINWKPGQTITTKYVASSTGLAGVPIPSELSELNTSISTSYIGREKITVKAGTFEACKFEDDSETVFSTDKVTVASTRWVVATGSYAGLQLRSESAGKSIQTVALRFNGS